MRLLRIDPFGMSWPVGRLDEIRTRPDADRIAYRLSGTFGETATLYRWPSAASLACTLEMQSRGPSSPRHFRRLLRAAV